MIDLKLYFICLSFLCLKQPKVWFLGNTGTDKGQTGTDRDKQGQTGTDRDTHGQTGTGRNRQGQMGADRDRQGQTVTERGGPCLSLKKA